MQNVGGGRARAGIGGGGGTRGRRALGARADGSGEQHVPVYTARGPAHFLKSSFFYLLIPKVIISQSGVEVVLVFRPF